MKSQKLGKNTSAVEILNISIHGVWVFADGREYFMSYQDYPWFKDANVRAIHNVELLHRKHLHWPELDVDLALESLESPEKYPLLFKK